MLSSASWLRPLRGVCFAALLAIVLAGPGATTSAVAKCCVWRVSSPDGARTLYLAGSVHALRPSDYPLPAAYDTAFAASERLAFESTPRDLDERGGPRLARAAIYPPGTELKDHVDPRTYAYLQRVLARTRTPESKIARLRPWALAMMLEDPSGRGLASVSTFFGVERYFQQKAGGHKAISGLENVDEHFAFYTAMSDAEAEAVLLLGFIQLDTSNATYERSVKAWRQGDTPALERGLRANFRDMPLLYQRLITERNRTWLPKLEKFLRGSQTTLVVAGAGHMGGDDGLPALLRARGYRVEQL